MNGGVYYYRVYTPMKSLVEMYPNEFDITINNTYKFTDQEKDEIGKNFDIVIVHQALYNPEIQDAFWNTIIYCKKTYGTRFVLTLTTIGIMEKLTHIIMFANFLHIL